MTAESDVHAAIPPRDAVAEARRARLLEAIRRQGSACGCETGSLFMIGALVSFVVYSMVGASGWTTGETLWRGGIWVLTWTLVGKAAGLGYARLRLYVLRSTLRREFDSPGS